MARSTSLSLDATDRALLGALQRDGRATVTELARRVNLSQPATSARIRRLEDAGVVTGYGARVDAAAIGRGIHAVLRLRTSHQAIPAGLDWFAATEEVSRVLRLTGEDCFLVEVHVTDAGRLEQIVDGLARFGPVTTSLVLREYPGHPLSPA